MEKKSLYLKLTIEGLNFQHNFVSQAFLMFRATDSREVSIKGNVYDFSVDYNSIDKSDILKIWKHLMTKNNIKYFSALSNKCLLRY